jgi:hypothetical protein
MNNDIETAILLQSVLDVIPAFDLIDLFTEIRLSATLQGFVDVPTNIKAVLTVLLWNDIRVVPVKKIEVVRTSIYKTTPMRSYDYNHVVETKELRDELPARTNKATQPPRRHINIVTTLDTV